MTTPEASGASAHADDSRVAMPRPSADARLPAATPPHAAWHDPAAPDHPFIGDREVPIRAEMDADGALPALLERRAEFVDIGTWAVPADVRRFRVLAAVRLTGRDVLASHAESWQVPICSTAWIADRVRLHGWSWLRSPLVVQEWDPAQLVTSLDSVVGARADRSWRAFVARMSPYLLPLE